MQSALRRHQPASELDVSRAPGHRTEPPAGAVRQRATHVAATHQHGMLDQHFAEREHRLRIARPKGRHLLEGLE